MAGTNIIDSFVARIGWQVDASALAGFNSQVNSTQQAVNELAGTVKLAAQAIVGYMGSVLGFTAAQNRATAVTNNLAAAVKIATEDLEGLGQVANSIGLDMDHVVDLIEEMNNKFGEVKGLGEMKSAQEGVQMLGLRWKELEALDPADQFVKVLDAAKELEDHQRATSAVDMIFGGEANKFLGALRNYEGSLEAILENYRLLNLQTEESRAGAVEFDKQWQDLEFTFQGIRRTFAGFLGGELSPFIEDIKEFIKANRELIRTRLKEWAVTIANAFKWLAARGMDLFKVVDRLAESLGGWGNLLRLIGYTLASMKFMAIIQGFQAISAAAVVAQAKILFIPLLIAAIIDDFVNMLQGNRSVIGDFVDWLLDKIAGMFGITTEELKQMIADFMFSVVRWTEDTWKAVSEFVSNAWDTISTFLSEVYDAFYNLSWDDVFNYWSDLFSGWIDKIKGWFADLWETISSPGEWFGDSPPSAQAGAFGGGAVGAVSGAVTNTNNITNNITQAAGENSEAFATRVAEKVVRQQMGDALKANRTGIRR